MDELSRLNALLEEERSALLRGDLVQVSDLVESKERLIGAANAVLSTEGADGLQKLKHALLRNQELLKSAMDGIGSVAERLGALASLEQSMTTYGADGHTMEIRTDAQNKIEKRA